MRSYPKLFIFLCLFLGSNFARADASVCGALSTLLPQGSYSGTDRITGSTCHLRVEMGSNYEDCDVTFYVLLSNGTTESPMFSAGLQDAHMKSEISDFNPAPFSAVSKETFTDGSIIINKLQVARNGWLDGRAVRIDGTQGDRSYSADCVVR